jgi:glycosyltransferase involved in cell wall biosynthesis
VTGLRERGWDVEVVAPRYPAAATDVFDRGPGGWSCGVTALPSMPLPLYPDIRLAAPAWRDVADVVNEFQPDIVHCATEFMIGRMGQRAALRRGTPAVSSYHTDFSRYTQAYGVPWLRKPVHDYLTRFHRRSKRVYTPGVPARDELHAGGVAPVEVWGRGVDIDLFCPARRDAMLRQAYGADDTFLFLHVGRLAAEKGVERILAAFAAARNDATLARPIRLIVAGSGPRESVLRQCASDGVTFLGDLDRRTVLPQLYASADAFVFASHTETLGLVVLEAMASGLPVIAVPAGGVADHLRDGVNGLACPPSDIPAMANAMVRIASSDSLRQTLATAARHTAEGLSWARELDRLDVSYREVCGM